LPCCPVMAVIGSKDRMGYAFGTARRLGIGFVFPDDSLEHPLQLAKWMNWMIQGGPPFGIKAHLEQGTETKRIVVRTRDDKPAVISEILSFFSRLRDDKKSSFQLRLILEETINNAIFHAFWDASGNEKYSVANFAAMESSEAVEVEYGADSRTIAITITDNQGRLTRDKILEKIQRQLNTQGIFDQNGRGIYLVYSLSGCAVFNLSSGKTTQIVTTFSIEPNVWPESSPLRPILIFDRD